MKLFWKKTASVPPTSHSEQEASKFKLSMNNLGASLFGKLQNLSRAIVLPIATLPVAGLLLGIGGGISGAFTALNDQGHHIPLWLISIFLVMKGGGSIIFDNLGLIFAVSIAFGFARASKGVAALSGLITFVVMSSVISVMFFPYKGTGGLNYASFDPWNITKGLALGSADLDHLGVFKNLFGLGSTYDTSVLGGLVIGWLTSKVHNRFYNIRMPRILAFFGGERFVPILAIFLGISLGITLFFLWPILLIAFQAIGKGMGSAMNFQALDSSTKGQLTGNNFHPSVAGAFIAFFFGAMERLLIPTGLHHVQYTPFWYTPIGGVWFDAAGNPVNGAYTIFFQQLSAIGKGHFNQTPGTMFMSGRFAFMQYGYPLAALAMWKLARPENRKIVGGILGSAALTSFLTGVTEPMLFSFLFVAPLCFAFHAFMAGISFMMAYCLNIVVGQGFAAGFIDFSIFGIFPETLGKSTGFYWVFVTGAIMAPAYYFGFYYIIKWKNYKTLGREDGEMATNIAMQSVAASLDKESKDKKSPAANLLAGLGGALNIIDAHDEGKLLTMTLKDINLRSEALIRLSGTKTVKLIDGKVQITYLDGAEAMHNLLAAEIAQSNKDVSSITNNTKPSAGANDIAYCEAIFEGLGGRDNIVLLDNCATRLRVTLVDPGKVNKDLLKSTGAVAVVMKGNAAQIIYGTHVGNIKNDMIKTWTPKA